MGAGKSTIGAEVARLTERPFIDLDREIEQAHGPIPALFAQGEPVFRRIEEETAAEVLTRRPAVIAMGGGALLSSATRKRLHSRAVTILVDVDVETAWARVGESERPLTRDKESFRRLYAEREALYQATADAVATDVDDVLLASLGIVVERDVLGRLAEFVPNDGLLALVADEGVLAVHRPNLGERLTSTHILPAGEAAKELPIIEGLWQELQLDRAGIIVALGGGATTDAAGFAAASYLRGIRWLAVPTTLVGQVDAAIGGKTAINLEKGKNLVGAFHLPTQVICDPDVLATLPERERLNGVAEVIKTSLLAGHPYGELDDEAMVRGCAAFKAAVCLSDPRDQGRRAVLNLGHTFAHALEAGAGFRAVTHGQAVALGLTAALSLSIKHLGLDRDVLSDVESVLEPKPVPADPEVAWAALQRDKKARGGRTRLVLLEAPGRPVDGVELDDVEVRAALNALIAA